MCPQRELFSSYALIYGGIVIVANNVIWSPLTSRLSTWRQKMKDWQYWRKSVMRQKFKKKTIIVTIGIYRLEDLIKNGALQIIKGALVVMKSTKIRTLYKMVGYQLLQGFNFKRNCQQNPMFWNTLTMFWNMFRSILVVFPNTKQRLLLALLKRYSQIPNTGYSISNLVT